MANTVKMEDGSVYEFVGDPKKSVSQGGALLGKGGQGAVYKVKNVKTGQVVALKTYLMHMSDEFIANLRSNIVKGAPHPSFLWPLGLTEPLGPNGDRRGYIMEMYGKEYSSYVKIMKRKANFPSKEMQSSALIDLVDAFEALHAKGLSYQDLNDGGIVFDCQHGKVLICDNDNVAPDKINIKIDDEGHCIQGKFKFMAPEVAINMILPDRYSDRFSMAVLMFMLLTMAHPLDGAKRLQEATMTPSVQRRLYGTEPVFIFDPNNASNRPDPQKDANATLGWSRLPDFIQNLFIRALTSGLPAVGKTKDQLETERQSRPSEREWRVALHKWMDTLASCPGCKLWMNVNLSGFDIQPTTCPYCGKKFTLNLPVLVVKKRDRVVRTIVLDDGKEIPKCSVIGEASNDTAIMVKKSAKAANVYGLQNMLTLQWRCTQQGSKPRLVNANEIVAALNGVFIEFDYDFSGEIHQKK